MIDYIKSIPWKWERNSSHLVVFDDVMAQAVRTAGAKSIHCILGNLGHVDRAKLW